MRISTIVTFHNSQNHVSRCIRSILKSNIDNIEIIIIDDNSDDTSKRLAERYSRLKNVHFVSTHYNIGISECRNMGASMATGEYYFFIDVDRTVEKNTLKTMVNIMDSSPKIGILQPLLLRHDKSVESSGHFLSRFGLPYNNIKKGKGKLIDVFGARGALMIRRSVFLKIKGYDNDHRFNGEDTDLSWRTRLSGYRVVCSTIARTYHYKEKEEETTDRMLYRIYYSGSKTVVSMILKNTSFITLIWMMPLCVLAWLTISLKLLVRLEPKYAIDIYKGLGWNIAHFIKTMKKRKQIRASAHDIPDNILYGSMSTTELIKKAVTWYSSTP